MHNSDHRVYKPLYRAPGALDWEEKDWDFVLGRIARRVKDTRDKDYVLNYTNAVPNTNWQTLLDDYLAANTPKSNEPESANWWQHRPGPRGRTVPQTL